MKMRQRTDADHPPHLGTAVDVLAVAPEAVAEVVGALTALHHAGEQPVGP